VLVIHFRKRVIKNKTQSKKKQKKKKASVAPVNTGTGKEDFKDRTNTAGHKIEDSFFSDNNEEEEIIEVECKKVNQSGED